jgi:sugar lactone lactonase YvrE
MTTPVCIWPVEAELGEGPIWLAGENRLWFVDIKKSQIHSLDPDVGETRTWDAPSAPGFLAPVAGGGFIAGLKSGLHRFDPETGGFSLLAEVEPTDLGNRLNDGFVDHQGRLWFGSMHDDETALSGALYRLGADGAVARIDDGYCITNGPAVCPSREVLYHTDTLERVIYAFDIAPDGGLSGKRIFARIERPGAYPDGPIVDAAGCVWTGLFGGWGLERYSPEGALMERIELPCANVTKAAFGGEDLRTLYITTARKGLDADVLAAQPLAGGLFAVRVDTPGLPQNEVRLD